MPSAMSLTHNASPFCIVGIMTPRMAIFIRIDLLIVLNVFCIMNVHICLHTEADKIGLES